MSNEARMPPDVNAGMNAETPETPPAAVQTPEPQPVLSVNEAGVVSARKRGKPGPRAKKGRTAAKRKPEKKAPAARKVKGQFKPKTAKSRWKSSAKRTPGSKPKAEQKKSPKKKAPARKAAATKRSAAKRTTRR